jgi:DNA-binding CsgD family transcriptional regulator
MTSPTSPTLLQHAARIAEALAGLPAVATLDWCDDAARCLLLTPGTHTSGVFVATLTALGRITDLEAAGFATSGSDASARDRMLALRSRAESLRSIGWSPASEQALAGPAGGVLAELPSGAAWRSGPLAPFAEQHPDHQLVIAHAGIGPAPAGRSVVAIAICDATAARDAAALLVAISPVLARRALLAIGAERSTRCHWLSPKEQVVLELLTIGDSVREIADKMGRSPHTVHDHVKSLHRKLGASSRGELVARALGRPGSRPPPATAPDTAPENAVHPVRPLPEHVLPTVLSEPKAHPSVERAHE